ncbi:MAG: hypothetical protein ACR2PL_23450 [Dehalococcoidia bacterium]
MILLLTILSALAVVTLVVVLAGYLIAIIRLLESIGGSGQSWLAKIRWGVRAIDTQTAAIPPQVTTLNQGLSAVSEGLKAIDASLGGTIASVVRQGG